MLQMLQDIPFFYAKLLAELLQGEPTFLKKLGQSLPHSHPRLPWNRSGMIHLMSGSVQDCNLEIQGEFPPKTPDIP